MTHENNLENIKEFPISNIEYWFFGNLDATRLPSWFTQFRSHDSILRRIAQLLTRQGRFNEYTRVEINDLWKKVSSLENYVYELEKRLDLELKEIWEEIRLIKLVDARQDSEIEALKVRADSNDLRDDEQDDKIGQLIGENVVINHTLNSHNNRITNLENTTTQHTTDISGIFIKDSEQDNRLDALENAIDNLEPYLRDLYVDVLTGRISTVPRGLEEALKTLPGYDEGAVLRVNYGWPTWGFEPPALDFDTIFEYENLSNNNIRITSGAGTKVYQVDENDNETLIYEGTLVNENLKNLTSVSDGKIKIQGRVTKLGMNSWDDAFRYSLVGITKIHKWADSITTLNLGYGSISQVPESLPKMITSLRGIFAGAGRDGVFSLPEIKEWETNSIVDMSYAFYNANINEDLNSWDTSNVTNLEGIFAVKTGTSRGSTQGIFNNGSTPGIPGTPLTWNTENVKNFSNLARHNNGFNVDISGWDTSSGTNFNEAFHNSHNSSFNQDLSSWDMSNAIEINGMFRGAAVFNNGDEPGDSNTPLNWTVPVLRYLNSAFRGASSFNQQVEWDWGTNSRTGDLDYVFANASSFNQNMNSWSAAVNLINYGTGLTGLRYFFSGASSFNNGDEPGESNNPFTWTPFGKRVRGLFMNCISFNQNIDSIFTLDSNDRNNISDLSELLKGCVLFNQEFNLSIRNTFTAGNNPLRLDNIFEGCTNFNNGGEPGESSNPLEITLSSINNITTSYASVYLSSAFKDCINYNQPTSFNPTNVNVTSLNMTDYDVNTPSWLEVNKPVF